MFDVLVLHVFHHLCLHLSPVFQIVTQLQPQLSTFFAVTSHHYHFAFVFLLDFYLHVFVHNGQPVEPARLVKRVESDIKMTRVDFR